MAAAATTGADAPRAIRQIERRRMRGGTPSLAIALHAESHPPRGEPMATTTTPRSNQDHMFAVLEAAADAAHLRSFALLTNVPGPMRARVAQALNRCIEACTDSERTYALAATSVRDGRLRVMLHDQAKRRGSLVSEIQGMLTAMNCYAENEGTTAGALRRGLMDVRIAFSGQRGRLLLSECEHADMNALQVYDAVRKNLATLDLPKQIGALIDGQREVLFAGHSGVTGLLLDAAP
jgi:uncharacterized protein (TIGR02284 family)